MPYVDGKRISAKDWQAIRNTKPPEPAVSDEVEEATLSKPKRRTKSIIRDVALAATGAQITDKDGDAQ